MTLYPNVPFTDGTIWSPELAYLAFNPVFDDDTQYLGHLPRLGDNSLSNAPNQLKSRFARIENGLAVRHVNGLTVSIDAGVFENLSGVVVSVPGQQVVVPNNATSYVLINTSGQVVVQTRPDALRLMLAEVVTSGGTVTTISDLRDIAIRSLKPSTRAIKTFGGNNASDKTCTQGEVFDQGIYYFKSFTVPAGITINIRRMARILVAGDVIVNGTINVEAFTEGGRAIAVTVVQGGIAQGMPGVGLGASGSTYPWYSQPYGSSGMGGYAITSNATNTFCYTSPGGNAGGAITIEAAGSITVGSSGNILADGTAGGVGGSNPTFSNGQPQYPQGSGNFTCGITGGGGGSGGLIWLSSLTDIIVQGTLAVRGGNGGAGFSHPTTNTIMPAMSGGAGGGGGVVVLQAPNVNTTGSNILRNGGTSGAPGTISGLTTLSATQWRITDTRGFYGALASAGFGGTSANPSVNRSGGFDTYTATQSGTGLLIIQNFVPVG